MLLLCCYGYFGDACILRSFYASHMRHTRKYTHISDAPSSGNDVPFCCNDCAAFGEESRAPRTTTAFTRRGVLKGLSLKPLESVWSMLVLVLLRLVNHCDTARELFTTG